MTFTRIVLRIIVVERVHQLGAHFLHHLGVRRIIARRKNNALRRIELHEVAIGIFRDRARNPTAIVLRQLNAHRVEVESGTQTLGLVGQSLGDPDGLVLGEMPRRVQPRIVEVWIVVRLLDNLEIGARGFRHPLESLCRLVQKELDEIEARSEAVVSHMSARQLPFAIPLSVSPQGQFLAGLLFSRRASH